MTDLERLIQSREARAALAAQGAQAQIDALAEAAFRRVVALLMADPTMAPREAVMAVMVDFGGGFAQALAEAFTLLLERSIGADEVRALPIGNIPLSRHLYLQAVATSREVAAIVREHARGVQQAQALARRLYDGYDPRDGIVRPLEGRARASLPQALRTLTEDLQARRELTALLDQGQKQAARLKSPALRAAYLQAFEAWQQGAGRAALDKLLAVAVREKNRFFADRIARTELHAAHQTQVAADLMTDADLTVVEVRLNPAHPHTDICDLHARADLWGLGPGRYPKKHAPVPGFHPFCTCRLRPIFSASAEGAERVENGEAAYLRRLGPGQAARVMGSRARALAVLAGEDAIAVADQGKPRAYRTTTVGRGGRHALVKPDGP